MPFGRWELPQVDVVALEDVLGDWPVGDDRGWDGLDGIHQPLPRVHQVERRDVGGQAQADCQAGPLTLGVGQHPVPSRITGNVVEQDRRCAIGVHEHFGDPADVLLHVRRELADLIADAGQLKLWLILRSTEMAPHWCKNQLTIGTLNMDALTTVAVFGNGSSTISAGTSNRLA